MGNDGLGSDMPSLVPTHQEVTTGTHLFDRIEPTNLDGSQVAMTELPHSRYRLGELLGRGAMGEVRRAHDTVLGREVAIKELRPAPGTDPAEALDRFLVEAQAAAILSHPNIVGVYDVFAEGERVLITMELVEGTTLDEVIRHSGAQPPEVVRAIMAQVAQALAAAHSAGVVHRDLKPDNVFWTDEGRAVVADFGLARIGPGRGTVEGTIMGTPGYMAPEQVRGLVVGPAADVFGWGAVAYELITGEAPFGDPSYTDQSALAYRIVHEPRPALDLPTDPALSDLIARALAKDPLDRPRDGGELVGLLTRIPTHTPHLESAPAAPRAPAEVARDGSAGRDRDRRYARPLIICFSIVGVLMALLLIWAVLRPSQVTTAPSRENPVTTAPSHENPVTPEPFSDWDRGNIAGTLCEFPVSTDAGSYRRIRLAFNNHRGPECMGARSFGSYG